MALLCFFAILVNSLCFAVFVVFLFFALVTEVRLRSVKASLVDVLGMLCAILAPMPSVRWGSLKILYHILALPK